MDINLCHRIGKIRLEKGLNKREFADILVIPGSIISDIENCKREMYTRHILLWAIFIHPQVDNLSSVSLTFL